VIELPGHGSRGCENCHSTNHQTQTCPLMEEEMTEYTGRKKDLYDDLSAILRNYGYDDDHAHQLMEALDDE